MDALFAAELEWWEETDKGELKEYFTKKTFLLASHAKPPVGWEVAPVAAVGSWNSQVQRPPEKTVKLSINTSQTTPAS